MSGIHSTPKPKIRSLFAFIQARTGSTRFPKKVIRPIPPDSDKTILDHIHSRILKILPNSRIIYLIPEGDLELVSFLEKNGMNHFSGPLEDVRQRYILAAEKFKADAILRLTGDNPFYDTTHLDLLIQTFIESDSDLAYFKGLPLGTGGEVFRTSALLNLSDSQQEERHKEHVSIHIKEDPTQYKITSIPSLLTKEEGSRLANFRLTVDTPEDFETISGLLSQKSFESIGNFNTKEFLEWEKEDPSLFQKNLDVPQVKFNLPSPSQRTKGKIGVLVAPAKEFGSGHFSRTSLLYSFLPYKDWEPEWISTFPKDGEYDILLIDFRDIEIPIPYRKTKVLLLDHFGEDKKKYNFWDLLPHSENDQNFDWEQILIPPNLISSATNEEKSPAKEYGIFCYAGNLGKEESENLDRFLIQNSAQKKIRIGGTPPKTNEIEYFPRLSRVQYLQTLRSSEKFLGYFGQSVFEALYLRIPSATFSISPIHRELSSILEKYKIPFTDLSQETEFSLGTKTVGENGYKVLLNKIDSIY
ncbi:spore coat biosynthesis protein F [Leptospira selangorensis]|uniref:Spore coat biosynthesis protein F n=1 Tax=Leptospira selangorensis TaxID=2484982 RepID=A0A5F2C720_9LEPT|nr:spore coat biosynthesis protein F [Leptospira selangorensis]TGM12843.1 spore coat biosynthesis protein F [Leptospira selangorensis]TGM30904.1 spore coat biosynthesis protein F [Leptospira selangorensis]